MIRSLVNRGTLPPTSPQRHKYYPFDLEVDSRSWHASTFRALRAWENFGLPIQAAKNLADVDRNFGSR